MPFTKQETFDIVAKHLITQGVQAKAGGGCVYRGDNGTKCAAGCLIPDSKYEPRFEGCTINWTDQLVVPFEELRFTTQSAVMLRRIIASEGHDPDFVRELQSLHDEENIDDNYQPLLLGRLKRFAEREKLDGSKLDAY